MVPRDEGSHLSETGNITTEDGWDAAWDSGDENSKANPDPDLTLRRHRSSLDEERAVVESSLPVPADVTEDDPDDGADAWGWGEDDGEGADTASAPTNPELTPNITPPPSEAVSNQLREITIAEKYWTSSMPQPVLQTVVRMYEDAATLTQDK
jgi:centromere/kinetochore protein ZW10